MSEYVNHDQEGAYISFNSEAGQVIGRIALTTMFTFDFEDRGVDHIFVITSEDEDCFTGPYLFRVALENQPDLFDKILNEMRQEGFAELHADKPDEADQAVFDAFVDKGFAEKVTNKKIRKWLEDGKRPSC